LYFRANNQAQVYFALARADIPQLLEDVMRAGAEKNI
jgi:hypothetical protein